MVFSHGDFNGDGKVDINDLTILLTNYGWTSGLAGVAAVPEPGALGAAGRRPRRPGNIGSFCEYLACDPEGAAGGGPAGVKREVRDKFRSTRPLSRRSQSPC